MKLSILQMQAIDYVLQVDEKTIVPYYSSNEGKFTPTFFQTKNNHLSLLFKTERDQYPRLREFTEIPAFFRYVHEDFWEQSLNDFEYLETLKLSVLQNGDGNNESSTIGSIPYHPINSVISIKFESGFELLNYELSESSYDLIGFSRN